MRRIAAVTAIAAIVALGACKKTGEGEFQVQTPDVDVNTDTTTIQTPSVDVRKDTVTVEVPKVDVKTPSERKRP